MNLTFRNCTFRSYKTSINLPITTVFYTITSKCSNSSRIKSLKIFKNSFSYFKELVMTPSVNFSSSTSMNDSITTTIKNYKSTSPPRSTWSWTSMPTSQNKSWTLSMTLKILAINKSISISFKDSILITPISHMVGINF